MHISLEVKQRGIEKEVSLLQENGWVFFLRCFYQINSQYKNDTHTDLYLSIKTSFEYFIALPSPCLQRIYQYLARYQLHN